MTVYVFSKSFICKNIAAPGTCEAYITSLVQALYPQYNPGVNGHTNSSHQINGSQTAHIIELVFYTNSVHEYHDYHNNIDVVTTIPKTQYSSVMPINPNSPI